MYISRFEIWVIRIGVPTAIVLSLLAIAYGNNLAGRINETLTYVVETNKTVLEVQKNQVKIQEGEIDVWTVLNAMAEDYPPKKTLSERQH